MKFFQFLRTIDRKFSLGLLLGIVFGAVGLYAAFVFERRPHVTLDVFSNTAILDVKEDLGGLEVLFNGVDIQESNQTLRILLVRLVNDGQVDLMIDRFDTRDLPGFEVTPGQIVQPPNIVEASSDYLWDNLSIRTTSPSIIRIDPVILERGQHFTVKILLLIPKEAVPQVQTVGKIAGVRTISVSTSFTRTGTAPFLTRAFSGDVPVHFARLLAYTLLAIILLIAGVLAVSMISDFLSRRKRSRLVWRYVKSLSFDPHQAFRQLLDLYVKEGDKILYLLANVSNDARFLSKSTTTKEGEVIIEGASPVYSDTIFLAPDFKALTRSFELADIIEKRASGHLLNRDIARLLPDFVRYLRKEGAIEKGARLSIRNRRTASRRPTSRRTATSRNK